MGSLSCCAPRTSGVSCTRAFRRRRPLGSLSCSTTANGCHAAWFPCTGGLAWLSVVGSFAAHVVVLGMNYSMGIVVAYVLAPGGLGHGELELVSWAPAMAQAMMLFGGLWVGLLVQRYGCRPVAITGGLVVAAGMLLCSTAENAGELVLFYGLIVGVGQSMCFLPAIVTLTQHFSRRRTLATGAAVSGSSVGTVVIPLWLSFMLETWGFSATFQVLAAGIGGTLVVAGLVYLPVQAPSSATAPESDAIESGTPIAGLRPLDQQNPAVTPRSRFAVLCKPGVREVVAAGLFQAFGYFVPFFLGPEFATEQGVANPSRFISIIGVASFVGRVLTGVLAGRSPLFRLRLLQSALVVAGGSMFLLLMPTTAELLDAFGAIFGLASGPLITLLPLCVADACDPVDAPVGMGGMMSIQIISTLAGSPIAAAIKESTDSYDGAWILGAVVLGCAACALGVAPRPESRAEVELRLKSVGMQ